MTFRGLHELSLDPKNRVNIPAALRPGLADGIVLRPNPDNCIEIWPESGAEEKEAETMAELNPFASRARCSGGSSRCRRTAGSTRPAGCCSASP